MKVILHRRNSKLDIPLIRKRLEDKPLEYILEALREIYGNAVFQYLSMYLDTNPNYNVNHIAIALLAKYYKLKYVITLNFDVLFEHALQRFKVSYNVVHPLSKTQPPPVLCGKSRPEFTLIKPHGSFERPCIKSNRDRYLKATLSQADRPSGTNRQKFGDIFSECPDVLVAGYRDNDWDISPLLSTFFKKKVRHITWVIHSEPSQEKEKKRAFENAAKSNEWASIDKWRWYGLLKEVNPENVTFLCGNVSVLLEDIIREMNIHDEGEIQKAKNAKGDYSNALIPTLDNVKQLFYSDEANCLPIIYLLNDGQTRRAIGDLIGMLYGDKTIKNNYTFQKSYLDKLAWYYHVEKDFDKAVRFRKENLRLARKHSEFPIQEYEQLIHTILTQFDPFALFARKYTIRKCPNLFTGLFCYFTIFFNRVVLQKPADKIHIAKLTFNTVNYFYKWLLAFAFISPKHIFLLSGLPWIVSKGFDYALKRHSEVLNWEYFWLVSQEAKLISKQKVDYNFHQRLDEIESYFRLTDQPDHILNAELIKILYQYGQEYKRIGKVEKEYQNTISPTMKLKLLLYKKFMGLRSISLGDIKEKLDGAE
jgi:hypothetical protein